MLTSLLILTVTMAMIALQKLPGFHHNRPTGALTGAVLMLLAGELTLDRALAAIDLRTLALLFGLMVMVVYLEEGGAFALLAARVTRLGRGPALIWAVLLAAGILSALFMNDTICLLFAPLILTACRRQGIDPVPPLTALILGANIGSLMLPIGNPQQAFIAMHSGIAFADYARRMVPIGLACLIIAGLLLQLYHRRSDGTTVMDAEAASAVAVDRTMLLRAVPVLVGMLIAMLAGASLALAALTAASAMLLIGRRSPDVILARINWPLLLMFTGLFVVMAGVRDSGLAQAAFNWLSPLLHGSATRSVFGLGLFTLAGSNLVSNVPFVMLAAQWMPSYANPQQAWLVLAAASTLAGNLTLVGSVAALIVAEQAEKQGQLIRFGRFAAIGVPVTLATTMLALGWLYLAT
jgi:Na+/H+ antiporter NhaD/arsenite permease-like protein